MGFKKEVGVGELVIPRMSYGEFSEALHARMGDKRLPYSGSIELTFRCNLRCAHCYVNLSAGDQEAQMEELTLPEIRGILDEAAEAGCLWLLITGGEPLLRPDFPEIYTYAKQKGFIITLFTNATLITEATADLLADYPPMWTEVTLYGASPQTYERITGNAAAFERCLQGIRLLRQRGLPMKLKTMLMTLNKDDLVGMKALAEEMDLPFRYDPILNPRLDGSMEPCELRLSPQEIVAMDLADEQRLESYQDFCDKFLGPVKTDCLYGCGAGEFSFHIDPYGRMAVCMTARWPSYDLRKGSFREGFYEFFPRVRSQRPKTDSTCRDCDIHNLCSTCPGLAYMETRDQEAAVDFYCRVAHERAKAFGRR